MSANNHLILASLIHNTFDTFDLADLILIRNCIIFQNKT